MLDQKTGIEIHEIIDDLKWQSSEMQRVLTDNIVTFQRSYLDLQGPLLEVEKAGQELIQNKKELNERFNRIWNGDDDQTLDDFALDLENALKEHFSKLEDAVSCFSKVMNMLTKTFKDKEYELTQKFTQKSDT